MAERPCKLCGMKIEFIVGPNGVHIPLQKIRTVYYVTDEGEEEAQAHKLDLRDDPNGVYGERYWVSHFETCPNASSFSRKGN